MKGARQLGTNNDQNTVDSADNLKQSKLSKCDAMSHFSQLLWFALYVFAKSHVSILKCAFPAMGSVQFGVFHSLMTRACQQANDTLPYHCTPYKSTQYQSTPFQQGIPCVQALTQAAATKSSSALFPCRAADITGIGLSVCCKNLHNDRPGTQAGTQICSRRL